MSHQLILQYFPDLSAEQKHQFIVLEELYREWNTKINVISRKDMDHFYAHHVLHSLAIAQFIQFVPGSEILDIGTGGGFPGIPLAILFPQCKFYLTDSIRKKINVVEAVGQSLTLKNIETAWLRAENFTGKVDFIVSRAVAPMNTIIEWSKGKFLKSNKNSIPNGIICLKGGDLKLELDQTRKKFRLQSLSEWFSDEWYTDKKIVYWQADFKN